MKGQVMHLPNTVERITMTQGTENIVDLFRQMTAQEFDQHLTRVNAENVRYSKLEFRRRQLLRATTPILEEFIATQVRERKVLLAYVLGVSKVYNEELERLEDSVEIEDQTHYDKLQKSRTEAEWITKTVHQVWPISTGYDYAADLPETQIERMLFIAQNAVHCFNAVASGGEVVETP
jgi:hypothetical protein